MSGRLLKLIPVFLGAFLLYLYGLDRVGMLSADEPRYTAIGQAMAATGDWVTPVLWGGAWFEKPALLYWMIGSGFRLGLPAELAARLPVALSSLAFLVFFYIMLRLQFGCREAAFSTAILATSAGWLAFSQVGVTDLPMSAAFAAAMLIALPWAAGGPPRKLWLAGAFLGLAVLAKGLVPLALASVPLLWMSWRRWRDGILPTVVALLVAAPWYIACYTANGWPFIQEFFVRHHFERLASPDLMHIQPFWYYAPVLLAGLFPWTPCLALIADRDLVRERRTRFLLLWLGWGFLFFSAAANKLPGYLLPLLPAASALTGIRLARARTTGALLALCALLAAAIPVVAMVLPVSLAQGLSRASMPENLWIWLLVGMAGGAAAWYASRAGSGRWVVAGLSAAVVAGVLWIKIDTYPVLDEQVSARGTWHRLGPAITGACNENLNRGFVYGLNFYAGREIPDCSSLPSPAKLVEGANGIAMLESATSDSADPRPQSSPSPATSAPLPGAGPDRESH